MGNFGERIIAGFLAVISIIAATTVSVKYGNKLLCSAAEIPVISNTFQKSESSLESTQKSSVQSDTVSYAVQSETQTESSTASKTEKKGKAAGKIYSQYMSPYTANTAYNNIYLNNQSGVKINIKNLLLGYAPEITINAKSPQVLILHTHATESYMSDNSETYTKSDLNRTSNEKKNVIGVGNTVAKILKDGGISVIHDKTLHDNPSYSGSYNRSAATVEKYLKKYPGIKIILDIHRDAIADGNNLVKPVAKINKKGAAQVMICVGSNTGSVNYFPKWKENLKLGLKLQQTLEVLYPGLARSLFLANDRCYNQNLSKGSIIIEFGTCANTFSEANYSAQLVGNALVAMLKQT